MAGDYRIRNMKPAELSLAIEWARKEGWDPGLYDHETFFAADPNGFFIGELAGEAISVASMINYDENSSFFGLYIVKEPYRHRGYGLQLTDHCLHYAGKRNIGLDGVLANVAIYQRKGFVPYYKNQRFHHIGRSHSDFDPHVKIVTSDQCEAILAYDRSCFFADREAFLKKWISQPGVIAVAYIKENTMLGYGVCRICYDGYKIGPLFADSLEVADSLFQVLQNNKVGKNIYLDVPEINPHAALLAEKYNMRSGFAVIRMYNKFLPHIHYEKIFGNTSFELG